MKNKLKDFFDEEKIEYYSVLDYKELRETSPEIMKRESFAPKSIIIYLLPYYTGETVNISRYAASFDYHIKIREVNQALASLLEEQIEGCNFKGYGDHSPIDERDAAVKGGLGIIGQNGLLINEKYGSYIFIGDIVTDISPELLGASAPLPCRYCEGCGACKRTCPTGVLRGESPDCLSMITQKKGNLTEEESSLMRKYNTAWGCDLCQTSCPHNKNPKLTPLEFFFRERREELTRDFLDSLDKKSFEERAYAWRGRRTVERNLDVLGKEK